MSTENVEECKEKPRETTEDNELPDKVEEKNMSLKQKLFAIDEEIRLLHQFCLTKGFTPIQVEENAKPILDCIWEVKRKRLIANLYKVAVVVAVIAALYYWNPAYRILCLCGRLVAIKFLPLWDWSKIYNQICLVENPYYTGNLLTLDDCELCESLDSIPRINNVSHVVMAEDYVKRDVPVIVTDGMIDWPAKDKFSTQFLHKLYTDDPALRNAQTCMFTSNVRIKYGSGRSLLYKAISGEISNWYSYWENCEKQAAKALRLYYRRPYFIPPMVEMAESNWLFVASHYKGKKDKPTDIGLPMIWYAQVKGESKVTILPRNPCEATCSKLVATLHEGEILVLTDMMWLLDYLPMGPGETIAIGTGGYFD